MIDMAVIDTIQALGFPIVSFLLMYHLVATTIRKNTIALIELKALIEAKL